MSDLCKSKVKITANRNINFIKQNHGMYPKTTNNDQKIINNSFMKIGEPVLLNPSCQYQADLQ